MDTAKDNHCADEQHHIDLDWGSQKTSVPDLTNSLTIYLQTDTGEADKKETDITTMSHAFLKSSGGFGVVRLGSLINETHEEIYVAVKFPKLVINWRTYKHKKRFRSEAVVWQQLRHENVLPFLGIAQPPGMSACLVSPYVRQGNIRRYLSMNPAISRIALIQGVVDGLAYLHNQEVIHGDQKGGNVLVSDEGKALLCDFGLSAMADGSGLEKSSTLRMSGSLQWMSIELISSDEPGSEITKSSDIWALAMAMVEILTNKNPFGEQAISVVKLYDLLNKGMRPSRPASPECSDALWDIIRDCWRGKPDQRPSMEKVSEVIHSLAA